MPPLIEVPTIRERSRMLAARYPAADPYVPDADPLVPFVQVAEQLVSSITGRDVDVGAGEAVPPEMTQVAVLAVQLMTEQVVVAGGGDAKQSEAAAGGQRLRSISAGPWSESYFAPGELTLKNGVAVITGNMLLDQVLWSLMTQEKRDEWFALATGVQPPAAMVTAHDYRRQGGGYSGRHFLGGAGFGVGPDGF